MKFYQVEKKDHTDNWWGPNSLAFTSICRPIDVRDTTSLKAEKTLICLAETQVNKEKRNIKLLA